MKCPDGCKYIYKIINSENGKVYIGQSVDPDNRFCQHSNGRSGAIALYNAISLYGKDKFTMEIIEGPIKNYNERETYWIAYYDSTNREKGYNINPIANSGPILTGEDSSGAKYTDEQIEKVLNELKNTNNSYKDIGEKYDISAEYVFALNIGRCRRKDGYTYPIRKANQYKEGMVHSVLKDLMFTTKTIEEIRKQYDISYFTIDGINSGTHCCSPKHIMYPVRGHNSKISRYLLNSIIGELKYGERQIKDIARDVGLSDQTIIRINQGKYCKVNDMDYPIRKNSRSIGNRGKGHG